MPFAQLIPGLRRWRKSGEVYLYRDEFTTPLGVGAINGTNCEPGPGVRKVNDPANHATIASGKLTYDGGGGGEGNPGYHINNLITRAAGRILISNVTPSVNNNYLVGMGYDDNTSGDFAPNGIVFWATGNIFVRVNSGYNNTGKAYTGGVNYKLALVLRAAGVFAFVKGGTMATWTLLWVGAAGAGNGYAAVAGYSMAATCDFVRVPFTLWLPSTIADPGIPHLNDGADMYAINSTDYAILDRWSA